MNYQEEFNLYLEQLTSEYKKLTLTKKELSKVLGISESTINNYIAKCENLPNYKKIGNGKNSKVLFPIVDIAKYLTETIKVS